ncbi:MAG: ATP phosphoribosyltransferase regulatory subunit [Cocleimonas sp.]|nr:ATP phosphoribosyltransferase regulatory subunit [Cocleimonas sp.]
MTHYQNLQLDLTERQRLPIISGIIYTALTPAMDHTIAQGGCYDPIDTANNRRTATGFTTTIRTLATLSQQESTTAKHSILASYAIDKILDNFMAQHHHQGQSVIRQPYQHANITPKQQGCDRC